MSTYQSIHPSIDLPIHPWSCSISDDFHPERVWRYCNFPEEPEVAEKMKAELISFVGKRLATKALKYRADIKVRW